MALLVVVTEAIPPRLRGRLAVWSASCWCTVRGVLSPHTEGALSPGLTVNSWYRQSPAVIYRLQCSATLARITDGLGRTVLRATRVFPSLDPSIYVLLL